MFLLATYLSGRKWQSGTVVQQTSPTFFQVQPDNGRTLRRHIDDDPRPNLPTAESDTALEQTAAEATPVMGVSENCIVRIEYL